MKPLLQIILLLNCFLIGHTQETAITIYPDMILPEEKVIELHKLNGWIFKKGSDTAWARKGLNVAGWQKLKPTELSEKLADDKGKLECWLRLKIKLDTTFKNTNFALLLQAWAAMDVYIDGILIHSYGNTGANGEPFREYNPSRKFPIDFNLEKGREYEIAIHFVDFVSPFPPHHLKSEYLLDYFIALMLPKRHENFIDFYLTENTYHVVWLSVNLITCLLFWLLTFQNREEKNLRLIALTSTLLTLLVSFIIFNTNSNISFIAVGFSSLAILLLTPLTIISILLLIAKIFNRQINWWQKVLLAAIFIAAIAQQFFAFDLSVIIQISLAVFIVAYYIFTSWKKLKGAQWAVVVGTSVALVLALVPIIPGLHLSYATFRLFNTGLYLSYPLSLLTYVTMRFREIIKKVQENSRQVLRLSEEKRQQALNQQKILQEEVNRQTAELRNTLDNLKSTQAQLIR